MPIAIYGDCDGSARRADTAHRRGAVLFSHVRGCATTAQQASMAPHVSAARRGPPRKSGRLRRPLAASRTSFHRAFNVTRGD